MCAQLGHSFIPDAVSDLVPFLFDNIPARHLQNHNHCPAMHLTQQTHTTKKARSEQNHCTQSQEHNCRVFIILSRSVCSCEKHNLDNKDVIMLPKPADRRAAPATANLFHMAQSLFLLSSAARFIKHYTAACQLEGTD